MAKTVIRSIRFDAAFDAELERDADARGVSVSEYVRQRLTEASVHEIRRDRLAEALRLAASLTVDHGDRQAMWGGRDRVPD